MRPCCAARSAASSSTRFRPTSAPGLPRLVCHDLALARICAGTGPLWAWHWATVGMALARICGGTRPVSLSGSADPLQVCRDRATAVATGPLLLPRGTDSATLRAWHWATVGMALGHCGHGTGPHLRRHSAGHRASAAPPRDGLGYTAHSQTHRSIRITWARRCHICVWAGQAAAVPAPGLGSPLPHLRRNLAHRCRRAAPACDR
jgi:hypothetical protein